MDTNNIMQDTYKLMGVPVGNYGSYAFYKAMKICRKTKDHIIAVGDFFFVKIWPDSELMAIGELQLLWTDRGAGRSLASLRLYFLPENTPAGRAHHGEDEVLGISERVVVRCEELVSWVCGGRGWRWGLKAKWTPPPERPASSAESEPATARITFEDIDKEKALIAEPSDECVVVFSYPKYCRYRAMMRRLEGTGDKYLREPLVLALGGYIPPSANTRILYCRDTFEYPELEGHEFVCNHMAPRLKARPGRGRRRRARSASRSSDSESEPSQRSNTPQGIRTSLRVATASPTASVSSNSSNATSRAEERAFMQKLKVFHKSNSSPNKSSSLYCKELNLHQLYGAVIKAGGYESVTRARGWRRLLADMGASSTGPQAIIARKHYERVLLPYEKSENGTNLPPTSNGMSTPTDTPPKLEKKNKWSIPIATIDISDSPIRDVSTPSSDKNQVPRLSTPPLSKRKSSESKKSEMIALHNGDKKGALEAVKKKILNANGDHDEYEDDELPPENHFDPSNILNLNIGEVEEDKKEEIYVTADSAAELNQEFLDSLCKEESKASISVVPAEKLMNDRINTTIQLNGTTTMTPVNIADTQSTPTRSRPSSLRSVRVKPDRRQGNATSSSPPAVAPPTVLPPPSSAGPPSDDDLIEVPYKPKTPEIIDLDLYESPESPKSAKQKKLDILKRGGLEVTAVRGWPGLDPALQQQILNQAHFLQMYGTFAPGHLDGVAPPKVTQGKSIYGSSSPEKTVYGNPKDPFMPPPHILQGITPRKIPTIQRAATGTDILDLTIRPAVEIMKVPSSPDQPQNLSSKKVCNHVATINEPRQINSALEITLVQTNKNRPPRPPQKRSSTGKFMSNKPPCFNNPNSLPVPPLIPRSKLNTSSSANHNSGSSLVIPSFQASSNSERTSPTTSVTTSLLQGAGGTLMQGNTPPRQSPGAPFAPLLDTSLYMSALYSTLGQMPSSLNEHQLALYKELITGNIMSHYPSLTGVSATPTPTSKN